MEGALCLLGGGSSGVSTNEPAVSFEATSYPAESELELGLGLSLGGCSGGGGGGGAGKAKSGTAWGECGRILIAKDFPSVVSQRAKGGSSSAAAVSGTKRAADTVAHESGSPTAVGTQVVGWPPIRAYRMNSLKAPRAEEEKSVGEKDKSKEAALKRKIYNGNKTNCAVNEKGHLGFVKVNMDGVAIGRKVDLNAHACYETLAQTIEDMFFRPPSSINSTGSGAEKEQTAKPSILLVGSSEFVLTYEDKEGDWMLVGDVPWRMFLSSVRRLRIMRTSEANGLAPRLHERNDRQRTKPI